jgi:hypothetical protein
MFFTRRRWAYWMIVTMISAVVAWSLQQHAASVEHARSSWGTTRTVMVATADLQPDGALDAIALEMPAAMVPSAAIAEIPPGARVHQRVMDGEIITAADLVAADGPAAHAQAGSVVVGVIDPLTRNGSIGLIVQVVSEGVVLAEHGTVVAVVDEVIFVAVDEREAPSVAAAAQSGLASLLFLP